MNKRANRLLIEYVLCPDLISYMGFEGGRCHEGRAIAGLGETLKIGAFGVPMVGYGRTA